MIALARPDVRLHRSWAEAVIEFGSEQIYGSGSWEVPEEVRGSTSLDACGLTVEELLRRGDPHVPVPDDPVRSDHFWITDDGPGRVRDHNAATEEVVGSSPCATPSTPSCCRAAATSATPCEPPAVDRDTPPELGLDHLAVLGVERALLAVEEDNVASRRTIEGTGGRYVNSFGRLRRYWIDLA